MKSYRDASELALAFSAVMREMQSEFARSEHLPIASDDDFEAYQMFMSRVILLQKDLEEFIDRAMTLEAISQDSPLQVLDFSSEWEGFD